MLYVLFNKGEPVLVTSSAPILSRADALRDEGVVFDNFKCSWDYTSFYEVEQLCAELLLITGVVYIPTDAGPAHGSRYNIMVPPKVGDAVSYSFNGDSYPCGTITKVSATMKKITTSTGDVFYRRMQSAQWIKNGTWTLLAGHVSTQNPSF